MEYLLVNENELQFNEEELAGLTNDIKDRLAQTKCKIDSCYNEWDIIKKEIHLYEYVYTSSFFKKNISSTIPISRSFFKMKEMIVKYNLLNENQYKITCLAEAPGGFIQAFLESDKVEKIYGITLISEDKSIPYWHKSLLNEKRLELKSGVKENGDLYCLENVLSFIKDIGKSQMNIVTGDGGFDYSGDYNNQEQDSIRLIYSEIFLAINLQKKNGVFICKIFDIFSEITQKMLYILYLSYEKICFYKPCISRLSNSEKYIVCYGFRGYNKVLANKMIHNFKDKDIDIKMDKHFMNMIYNYNSVYSINQMVQINVGIDLIKQKKIRKYPSKEQINYAIYWCKKYNIQVNRDCFYLK
jgi:23S rRNA U2552 (ribose-2'-O)-methylase RlmE/FtsJ